MKKLTLILMLFTLSACGISEGDKVLIIPDDKIQRTEPFEATFIKTENDKAYVSLDSGKVQSYPSKEVYATDNQDAQTIATNRAEFFKMYAANSYLDSNLLNILIDKANSAHLSDWLLFLNLRKDIGDTFDYDKIDLKDRSKIEDYIEIAHSFDDLTEEVLSLTSPGNRGNEFAKFVSNIEGKLANAAYTISVQGINDDNPVKTVVNQVLPLPDLLVAFERTTYELETNSEYYKNESKNKKAQITKKMFEPIIKTAILNHGVSYFQKDKTLVDMAKDIQKETGIPKDILATYHGEKSWGSLLKTLTDTGKWANFYLQGKWSGIITVKHPRRLASGLRKKTFHHSYFRLYLENRFDNLSANYSYANEKMHGFVIPLEDNGKILIFDRRKNWKLTIEKKAENKIKSHGQVVFKGYLKQGTDILEDINPIHKASVEKPIPVPVKKPSQPAKAEPKKEVQKKAPTAVETKAPVKKDVQNKTPDTIKKPVIEHKPPVQAPATKKPVVKKPATQTIDQKAPQKKPEPAPESTTELDEGLDALDDLL